MLNLEEARLVADYLARGGTITRCPPGRAYGAPRLQRFRSVSRMHYERIETHDAAITEGRALYGDHATHYPKAVVGRHSPALDDVEAGDDTADRDYQADGVTPIKRRSAPHKRGQGLHDLRRKN